MNYIVIKTEDYDMLMGKKWNTKSNISVTICSKIYKFSINIYFVSKSQISQLPTAKVGQIVTENNVCLLFIDELDSDCHYVVLLGEGNEIFHNFKTVVFINKHYCENFI
jgi:hypothetical protein